MLLLFGLWLWLPPLWNAVAGSPDAAPDITLPAQVSGSVAGDQVAQRTTPHSTADDWQETERLRATDKLFDPAAADEIRGDAFTLYGEFLPIEAELAVEPKKPQPIIVKSPPPPAPPLTLRSTLVGPDRRAALINGKIYPEGSVIAAAGVNWTLRTVEPRRVLIDANGRTHELRIDPFTSSKSQIGRK